MDKVQPEIAVTGEMLRSLDILMRCGTRGTHLLFTEETIRKAFSAEPRQQADLDTLLEQLQGTIADVLAMQGIEERRDFIENLDTPVRDKLVHLYFGFLERYLAEGAQPLH